MIKRWDGTKDFNNDDNTGVDAKNGNTGSPAPPVIGMRLNKNGQPEDVGEFINREIRNYETGENHPVKYQTSEAQKRREEYARNLHNTLLQTKFTSWASISFVIATIPLPTP